MHRILRQEPYLGSFFPAAIGAKLTNPDKDVRCISGDGAAGFNIKALLPLEKPALDYTVSIG